MKKLIMFAAAMTIVGGAYAQDCTPTPQNCALVYNLKLNLRTSMGKAITGASGSLCAPGTSGACVRFPNFSYVVDGYLTVCDCECDSIMEAVAEAAWCTKLRSSVDLEFDWGYAHVIGNKGQAEATWALAGEDSIIGEFWLVGAGFGTFKRTNPAFFFSFSGYAAGELDSPICLVLNPAATQNCDPAGYWECDDLTTPPTEGDGAPLFGSWAIKANAAASKVYVKGGGLKVPSWL